MKTTGWIEFSYKLPYSNIEGRQAAYDFPIVVVSDIMRIQSLEFNMEYNGKFYRLDMAKHITEIYNISPPDQRGHFLVWLPMDVYNGRI